MLITPHRDLSLLAIDPGLNNMGLAAFSGCIETATLYTIHAKTIRSEKEPDLTGLDLEDYEARLVKRYAMGLALKRALLKYRPSHVVSESPFFDRRKPGSFAILTEVMATLYDTVVAHDPNIRFMTIPPQSVKKCLGIAGEKGKEIVKETLGTVSLLTSVLDPPVEALSEHAIDAVAVGYAYLCLKTSRFKAHTPCSPEASTSPSSSLPS